MVRNTALALLSLGCLFASPATAQDDLLASARQQFQPIPTTPPELPGNPTSPAKVELGKMLFFDPRLSASHAISCNSCHNIGLGRRRCRAHVHWPSLAAWRTQCSNGFQCGVQQCPVLGRPGQRPRTAGRWADRQSGRDGVTRPHVAEQLQGTPGYRDAFAKAFPGEPDPITLGNVQKAIAVFEATLITPNAAFDRFLKGDTNALSPAQKEGLTLFIDRGCASCHNGINVGGGMYAPFGVVEKPGANILPAADKGRFMVTKTASDEYVFKVPTLRNIALTAPYFHSGQAWDLRQAVAVMGASQLGIQLSSDDIDKITAFLDGLTGEQPKVTYPVLPPSVGATPQPQP